MSSINLYIPLKAVKHEHEQMPLEFQCHAQTCVKIVIP